jgi:hypothetical protein
MLLRDAVLDGVKIMAFQFLTVDADLNIANPKAEEWALNLTP